MNESFEKWWQTVPCEYTDVVTEDVVRAAYLAATEDAARIAEDTPVGMIAAAIREGK